MMFGKRDKYRKLHRRRRRRTNPLPLLAFLAVIVGGALYANRSGRTLTPRALSPALSIQHADPVVAQLTARDALANALLIATPQSADSVASAPPQQSAGPPTWRSGDAMQLVGALRKNETITTALNRRGVPIASMQSAIASLKDVVNFRRSKPGDAFEVDVDPSGKVTRLRVASSPKDVWETRREGDNYTRHEVAVATEKRVEVASGTINASLWQSFETNGASGRLAAAFTSIFAYTIDFATETQRGDKFYVAFESTWLDGKRLSAGKIVAARYVGKAGDHRAFLWNGAYYDGAGESVERQFLRSPLASVRITSSYGRRFHPVLGKMKMHAGVDYGAPTGTPVQAVAAGVVTWAGWKGANGNLVGIKHAGGYTTYYAHLSKISGKLRVGQRVKKKDVIGKVGSTGRSTGPHLHFGMKRNGTYINPLEVDFERGTPLGSSEKKQFRDAVASLEAKLK